MLKKELANVLSSPHVFPHVWTHSLAAYKLSYGSSFGAGEMVDLLHLVHATDVDVLVTNDGRMTQIAKQVFGSTPVVWTKEVFFKKLDQESTRW